MLEIEENEHDGAGKKKAKAEGGEVVKKRGGQLHKEMEAAASAAAASDDGMGGRAADGGVGAGDGMGKGEAGSVGADGGASDGGGVLAERTEGHAVGSGITMEAMKALFDQKLGPMAAEMRQMRGEVTTIKTMVHKEVAEVNGRIGRPETNLDGTAAKVLELEAKFSELQLGGRGVVGVRQRHQHDEQDLGVGDRAGEATWRA